VSERANGRMVLCEETTEIEETEIEEREGTEDTG
jgi:hypothetical protein